MRNNKTIFLRKVLRNSWGTSAATKKGTWTRWMSARFSTMEIVSELIMIWLSAGHFRPVPEIDGTTPVAAIKTLVSIRPGVVNFFFRITSSIVEMEFMSGRSVSMSLLFLRRANRNTDVTFLMKRCLFTLNFLTTFQRFLGTASKYYRILRKLEIEMEFTDVIDIFLKETFTLNEIKRHLCMYSGSNALL